MYYHMSGIAIMKMSTAVAFPRRRDRFIAVKGELASLEYGVGPMTIRSTAVILASFDNHALLVRFNKAREQESGWRLPRWPRGPSNSWKSSLHYYCKFDLGIFVRRHRFSYIKSVELDGKLRHFYALELTMEEAERLHEQNHRVVRSILVPMVSLEAMDTFGETERKLLRALAD
jgi:hypothetical protein